MYYAYVVIHTRILVLSARRWPINKNWINVINTDFFLLLEMLRFKKKWKSNTLHSCFAYWYQNKQLCLSPRLIFILKEELNIKFEVEKDWAKHYKQNELLPRMCLDHKEGKTRWWNQFLFHFFYLHYIGSNVIIRWCTIVFGKSLRCFLWNLKGNSWIFSYHYLCSIHWIYRLMSLQR